MPSFGEALANAAGSFRDIGEKRRAKLDELAYQQAQAQGYMNPDWQLEAPKQDSRGLLDRLSQPMGEQDNRNILGRLANTEIDQYGKPVRAGFAQGQAKRMGEMRQGGEGAGYIIDDKGVDEKGQPVTNIVDKGTLDVRKTLPRYVAPKDGESPAAINWGVVRQQKNRVLELLRQTDNPELRKEVDALGANPQADVNGLTTDYNRLTQIENALSGGVAGAARAKADAEAEEKKRAGTQKYTEFQAQQADKLRDEYMGKEKAFEIARKSMKSIESAAEMNKLAKSGIPSLRIVYAFQNAIDPGSVVRGEDVETIGRQGGLSGAAQTLFDAYINGQPLPPKVIEEIVATTKADFKVTEEDFRATHQLYNERADRLNLNRADVTTPRWDREWSKAKPTETLKPGDRIPMGE